LITPQPHYAAITLILITLLFSRHYCFHASRVLPRFSSLMPRHTLPIIAAVLLSQAIAYYCRRDEG